MDARHYLISAVSIFNARSRNGNLFSGLFLFHRLYIALLNACWHGKDALRCRYKSNALAILRMK